MQICAKTGTAQGKKWADGAQGLAWSSLKGPFPGSVSSHTGELGLAQPSSGPSVSSSAPFTPSGRLAIPTGCPAGAESDGAPSAGQPSCYSGAGSAGLSAPSSGLFPLRL